MWVDCSIWLRFGCDLAARTVELPRKFCLYTNGCKYMRDVNVQRY